MTDENQNDRPVTRDELRRALRALRYDAHYAYVLGDARDPATERAAERLRFVERFAELLSLDLGKVDR